MPMRIRTTVEMNEGAGARVRRLMPLRDFMNHDPFVLFDHFLLEGGGGFPDHPHRGFEAVTWLFEGCIEHADDLGNRSSVAPGGAQRFTAGSGIVHSETPCNGGRISGIQLWINLPRRLKSIPAAYQAVDPDAIPRRDAPGITERIIVGAGSPVALHTGVDYRDVGLDAGAAYRYTPRPDLRGFVYVVEGNVRVDGQPLAAGSAAFSANDGIALESDARSRVMLVFGAPHGEPIRQRGSCVD